MNADVLFQTTTSIAASKKSSNTQAANSYSSYSSDNTQSFKSEMDRAFDRKASTTRSTSAERQEKDKYPVKDTEKQDTAKQDTDVTSEQQALAAAQAQTQPTAESNEIVAIVTEGVSQIAESGQVQLMVGQSVQKQGASSLGGVLQATANTAEGQIQLPFQNSVDTVKAALLKEAALQQNEGQMNAQSQTKGMMTQSSDPTNTQTKTLDMDQLNAEKVDTTETDDQQVPLMAKSEPLDPSKVNIKVADAPVDMTKSNAADQMADKIIYKMSEGKQEFDLQLNPKELGKLNIKLTFENGNAQVLITCSNTKAQSMVASLTDNIRGILEANTGVTSTIQLQQEDMLQGQYNQDDFNGQSEARHSKQQQEKTQAVDDLSFIDKLRLGLIDGLDMAG